MGPVGSWVYLFSKFTSEALLFEALLICLLVAAYAGFWVLRKRRLGAADTAIPAGVVKGYLNELIVDAEQLRAQLFGLLSSAGVSTDGLKSLAAEGGPAGPEVSLKVNSLETKLMEQAQALEGIMAEKMKLEKDLIAARNLAQAAGKGGAAAGAGAGGSTGAAPAASNDAEIKKLLEKIQILESKLAEYSVIEDDLANLKRLQQENAQLRSALAGNAELTAKITSEAPAATAPAMEPAVAETTAAAPAPSEPAPAEAVAEEIEVPEMPEPEVTPAAAPAEAAPEAAAKPAAPEAAAAPAAPAAEPAADPNFENLVDQVEQSLKPAATAAPTPAPANSSNKSDADLVAEFEKMLNS